MKIKLILATLLFINVAAFGQTGFKQEFNGIASIEFNKQPTMRNLDNNMGLIYSIEDKPNYYFALDFDFTGQPIVTDADKLQEFYDGVVIGAVKPENNKTLVYQKDITVEGLKALEFQYKDAAKTDNIRFITSRVVFFGSHAFIYSFSAADDTDTYNTAKTAFFNSFKILNKTLSQY